MRAPPSPQHTTSSLLYVAGVTNPDNNHNTRGSCHNSTQGSRGVKGASNHTSQPPGPAGTAWLGARGRSAAISVRQCPCERPATGERTRTALRRKRGGGGSSSRPGPLSPPCQRRANLPGTARAPPSAHQHLAYSSPSSFTDSASRARLETRHPRSACLERGPGVPPPAGSASCSTQRPAALFQVIRTERSCRGLPEMSPWRRRQQSEGKASLSPAQLCLAPLQQEQPSPVTPLPARTWRPLSGVSPAPFVFQKPSWQRAATNLESQPPAPRGR